MKELKGLSTDFFLFWPVKSLETHSNPIQDGPFRGCSRMRGGGQKVSITHILQMMKLGTVIAYPKKIQKIYESLDTPLEFC